MNDITWFTACGITIYIVCVLVSFFGGGFLAKYWVSWLHKSIDPNPDSEGPRSWQLVWSLGFFERTVATILVIVNIEIVPEFIVGWLGLKTLAGWKETHNNSTILAAYHLSSLVGSAASLSFAIVVGLIAKCFLQDQ